MILSAMQRYTFISLFLVMGAPLALQAQAAALPDSISARLISPALFRLLDYDISRAAFGGKNVVRLELPQGPHWSRVAAHILTAINGRLATPADSAVMVIGIRDIRLVGDTLVASLFEESRQLCENGKWMSTGADYEARTRRVFGGGWTHIAVTPGLTWDGLCLRTRNGEL
jgi:hypothetical protein